MSLWRRRLGWTCQPKHLGLAYFITRSSHDWMWDKRKFGGRQTQPYCMWSQEYTHWSFVLTIYLVQLTLLSSFLFPILSFPSLSVSHHTYCPIFHLPFSLSFLILIVLSFIFLSPSPLLPLLTYFPIFHLPFSFSSPSFLVFLFFQLKVTHKQLALLLGAFAAYFSGNHTAVEGFMKEFHSKIQELQSNRDPPEWLEELPSPQDQQSN